MAKSLTHCGSAEAVLKPSLPTWAIDGVGSMLLRNLKKAVLIKPM
jgi:hypothetical protein